MKDLDIAEVSHRSGLPASTLRYYEDRGLIASIGRRGLRRQFDAGVLDQLALVTVAGQAGFSLDEIARMFVDGAPRLDRSDLLARAEILDKDIRRLIAMRDGLRHAAACPAPSHMECPTFRRILDGAPARAQSGRTRKRPAA